MKTCWCGNHVLRPFGPDYGECQNCGTLVYLKDISAQQLLVVDDETDFYGKQYWQPSEQGDPNFPDIFTRTRDDLTERNLHWLKALLKYRLPPASSMELGCAHGSFVALMQNAGYSACGVEMSPWVVGFGKATFGIPIYIGPVESLDIPASSLDFVVIMDVLEHLFDPATTMARCLELLKPDGVLLIQTPQFREKTNFDSLTESADRFLEMLIPDEHLFLFSQRSVSELFRRLGAEHINFEPAIFAHYDMLLAVSRAPLKTNSPEEIEAALLATPHGRIVLALDLREREQELSRQLSASEEDRSNRALQIESLTSMLKNSEEDRTNRALQIESLTSMLKNSEEDRTNRAQQIEALTSMLKESEEDRTNRALQIEALTSMLAESESREHEQGEQIRALLADLQILFSRPLLRSLNRLMRWPELNSLTKQLPNNHE